MRHIPTTQDNQESRIGLLFVSYDGLCPRCLGSREIHEAIGWYDSSLLWIDRPCPKCEGPQNAPVYDAGDLPF